MQLKPFASLGQTIIDGVRRTDQSVGNRDCFFLLEMAGFDLPIFLIKEGERLAKAYNNRSQVTTEQFYSRKYAASNDCFHFRSIWLDKKKNAMLMTN